MAEAVEPQRVWVVRPGKRESAVSVFQKQSVVALALKELGDLSAVGDSRKEFRHHYSERFPGGTPTSQASVSGQFFRFVHEIKIGDRVVVPISSQRLMLIAKVAGEYFFSEGTASEFPHRRNVKWVDQLSIDSLSMEAKNELGTAKTLFECRRHVSLFL